VTRITAAAANLMGRNAPLRLQAAGIAARARGERKPQEPRPCTRTHTHIPHPPALFVRTYVNAMATVTSSFHHCHCHSKLSQHHCVAAFPNSQVHHCLPVTPNCALALTTQCECAAAAARTGAHEEGCSSFAPCTRGACRHQALERLGNARLRLRLRVDRCHA
jgi:hypothetical protein